AMLIEWHVEVHAYEHTFVFQIEIADGEFCHAFFCRMTIGCSRGAQRPFWLMKSIMSRTRQEYPHSLSYQEITFTQLPPTTRVIGASTIDERASPRKSAETNSSSS